MQFLYQLPGFIVGICIAVMLPGAMVFLILIGGAHGGGNKLVDAMAATALIIVNALFYRLVFGAILKYRAKREGVTKLL